MADESTVETQNTEAAETAAPAKKTAARKTAAKKATTGAATGAKRASAPAKRTTKKAAAAEVAPAEAPEVADAEAPALIERPEAPAKKAVAKKTAAKKAAAPRKSTAAKKAAAAEAPEQAPLDLPAEAPAVEAGVAETTEAAPAKKTTTRRTTKKAASSADAGGEPAAKKAPAKRASKKAAAVPAEEPTAEATDAPAEATEQSTEETGAPGVLFQAPQKTARKRAPRKPKAEPVVEEPAEETEDELTETAETAVEADAAGDEAAAETPEVSSEQDDDNDESEEGDESGAPARRRRRRGGRRRRKPAGESNGETNGDANAEGDDSTSDTEGDTSAESTDEQAEDGEEQNEGGTSRRRRRRRRAGEAGDANGDDPENTVTRVRESRPLEQQITAVSGSTRLEAKKQRRREGREAGRRRAPIVSEAEFLARRESVERVMVIRQRDDLTQIGVLEDKVLVEHYVARESQTSLIGNIYLGRVQNVLPSMEAAFVDIGKGRNAVLYAGEVNWAALGHKEGQPRKIESVLSSGQTVLVQVTKDPIGHKGARLTSQISLAGRFLVYVPDGTTSGISRKLPDTERNRLKTLLKEIVPDSAGVIVRTAAEGASEEELTRDVERLKARWEDIEAKTSGKGNGNPQLLYGEPDLTLKVVRDLFTEDFAKLVIQGDEAWETVKGYVEHVAPDLAERLQRFVPGEDGRDAFQTYRIDEQIAKGLDRKVWLPSGGSLIIDRTEAMTVVDVNTGKFTGSGGNLEETVTKNNLEAAEEIVRQLRLRDIGGIIVVDFIDMVLESNRDLVLRRLVECLGRDRTRHQVAEVTSLGLVQMTRKRIGTGLLEAFSETCSHCHGRGVITHDHPVEEGKSSGVAPDEPRRSRRRGGKGRGAGNGEAGTNDAANVENVAEDHAHDEHKHPTPAEFAAMARHEEEARAAEEAKAAEASTETPEVEASDVVEPAEPAEAVVVEDFEVTPKPAELAGGETAAEPVVESTPAETPTVTVVTRSRARRGASRPAGVTAEVPTAPVVIPEPAAVPVAEAAAPEPPKVITRTRGGASRAVITPETSAETTTEANPEAETPADEHPVEHVPVKKRGARKR
jgi:ribonuclease E